MLASIWCPLAGAQTSARQDPARSPASIAATAAPFTADPRQAVLRKLGTDPHLVASGIEVAVNNAIVELSGTVPVSPWKVRAARVAGVVRGVRAVVNRIRIVPVRRPDSLIAKDVRDAVRGTAALAKMRITVQVAAGVVELTGVISSWEEQQLAERVASGVPGVRFCQNQLASRGSIRRTSAIIAADVQSRLDWDPLVLHAPIRVSVRGGRVFLAGTAGSPAERKRAIALAWVKSVTAVDAKALVVDTTRRPDANVRVRWPTDAEISAAIQDLIPYWASVNVPDLSTSVVAGVVTLRGTVPTLAEKRAVEEMVRSAVGVVDVRSELRGPWWTPPVQPPPPPPPQRKGAPRGR